MDSNQQFVPTDSNESKVTSPWTEWSTEFADPNSSVSLPVNAASSADGKAANLQAGNPNDDALMDCYNG